MKYGPPQCFMEKKHLMFIPWSCFPAEVFRTNSILTPEREADDTTQKRPTNSMKYQTDAHHEWVIENDCGAERTLRSVLAPTLPHLQLRIFKPIRWSCQWQRHILPAIPTEMERWIRRGMRLVVYKGKVLAVLFSFVIWVMWQNTNHLLQRAIMRRKDAKAGITCRWRRRGWFFSFM